MSNEPSIFLSYRRNDAGGHARALHEYLSGRFGAERIFFDRSTIESGDLFPEGLRQGVEGCAVLLALIGPDWLDSKGAAGVRRLDDPGDFVRQEIALALDRGKTVIPVLFDDTPVPLAHRLPDTLKDLAKHDALTLYGKTFEYQTQRRELVRRLAKVPGVPQPFAERLFRVPWPRNPFFTGREDTLQQLRQALATEKTAVLSQAIVITGLGGVGKTQTALEYAYRHRDTYWVIWWIDASGPAGLDRGVTELATDLALPGADPTDPERTRAALHRWLERETGWLLILDNAEQCETLRPYLPAAPAGHVLITSRNRRWGRATKLVLDIWPCVRSVEFLAKRADRADPAGADELAAELGDLPLALEQAAAYVEATGQSFAGYLALYRTRFAELAGADQFRPQDYPDTVLTTWTLSLAAAERDSPAAGDLLRLFAFLASEDIPRALLTTQIQRPPHLARRAIDFLLRPSVFPLLSRTAFPRRLARALADDVVFNKVVAALSRYSLIKAIPDTDSFTVHRLVQAVTRVRLSDRRPWVDATVALVDAAFPKESWEVRFWPACARLRPHAEAALAAAQDLPTGAFHTSRLLMMLAMYLYSQGSYLAAEPLYQRALAIVKKALGPEHPHVATSLNNLALLYRAQGRFAEAELLCQRALAIREKVLRPEHPHVATSLNNLALLYRAQGRFAEAEPLYQRALAIQEKVLGPEHPDLMRGRENYAHLLDQLGRHTEAAELRAQAQAIQ